MTSAYDIFLQLAQRNPDVLSDDCKFTLEPLDTTFSGKKEIIDFWNSSETTCDVHPTVYGCKSTVIVETLRMVVLDAEEMSYTPKWESLRGCTVCVDMVSRTQECEARLS